MICCVVCWLITLTLTSLRAVRVLYFVSNEQNILHALIKYSKCSQELLTLDQIGFVEIS